MRANGLKYFGPALKALPARPDNMFIGDPPGNHDRILDFSTAATGVLFFVPTRAFLEDRPWRPESQRRSRNRRVPTTHCHRQSGKECAS
jgi:hypothetical protein